MVRFEFDPLCKQIETALLKGGRFLVNVMRSDLAQLRKNSKLTNIIGALMQKKEVIGYSIQKLLYDVETEAPHQRI